MITALRTGRPSRRSAISFSRDRMIAEISCGVYSRSPRRTCVVAAHPPLDRADGALGIQQELVARLLADEQVAAFGEPDDRGQDHRSLLVGRGPPAARPDRARSRSWWCPRSMPTISSVMVLSPLPVPRLADDHLGRAQHLVVPEEAGADLLDHDALGRRTVRRRADHARKPRVERPSQQRRSATTPRSRRT